MRSAKLKALVALLATAPDGKRSRSWLQDMLWSLSGPEHGRASLRQGLSALRRTLGPAFDYIFLTTNDTVRLRQGCFAIVGDPSEGEVLEGLDIAEEGFSGWLREQRAAPSVPAAALSALAPATAREETRPAIVSAAAFARVAPVVAVLPFAGVDEAALGSQLGDAIAQDITRSLSRSPFLAVISHLSCRNARLRSAGLDELRTLLDADYVVCGHVRLSGARFRLDVDFVDVATGELRWTRDYAGLVPRFFDGSDDAVQAVADATTRTIFNESVKPVAGTPLPDIATHRLMMAGIALMHRQALGSFAKARECLEEVIRRAPKHSLPYAWLAKWYVLSIHQGWSVDAERDANTGCTYAQRALEQNPTCSFSLSINGFACHNLRDFDQALSLHEEALAYDPNNALSWLLKGTLHAFVDEGEEAVNDTQRARALSPLDPHRYFFAALSATAHLAAGDYAAALGFAEESLRLNRRHTSALRARIVALQLLGRESEAVRSVGDLLRSDPEFTVEKYRLNHPAGHYRTGKLWASAMLDAGVPLH